ncbi:MAG: hypothetical protein NVS3B21_07330 [Acidimicrobiales bacterium]
MPGGKNHHFKRSSRRVGTLRLAALITVPVAAIAVFSAGGLGTTAVAGVLQKETVSLTVHGVARQVAIDREPTVSRLLGTARLQPVVGHLRSARSNSILPGHDIAPRFLVDGVEVTGDTPLHDPHSIVVVDGADVVEGTTVKDDQEIPAPAPPVVEYALWHPGRPGHGRAIVGLVSGEVVSSEQSPPSPPSPVSEKVIALTFDDGPWPDTPAFLKVLHDEGVRATFCMIGRQIQPMITIVHQVADAGMTMCNHTVDHNMYLDRASAEVVHSDVQGGHDALTAALNKAPILYRPPGGTLSPEIVAAAGRAGEQVIHWTIDSMDYRKLSADAITQRVVGLAKPGAIVLLHDGGGDRLQTLIALPRIIETLRAQGYAFATPDTIAPVALPVPEWP